MLVDCRDRGGYFLAMVTHLSKLIRLKNKGIARLTSSIPAIGDLLAAAYTPRESRHVPWTPVIKPLVDSKIALVTTAGVHHPSQAPFDMHDPSGDASYRVIDTQTIETNYVITHDYYDHRGADQDLNVVFPITRLREMAAGKIVGSVAPRHFSFMGHIKGAHLAHLTDTSAPAAAAALLRDQVNAVLLTPG